MDWLNFIAIYYIPITVVYSLLIGSFLNVVIYRVPKMLEHEWQAECHSLYPSCVSKPRDEIFNLCLPRSQCPSCHQPITVLDNIPILSWLFLGGKCRHCQNPISKRYPFVELLTALLATVVAIALPFSSWSVAVLAATYILIALCFIDFDTMLLPDQITQPFLWMGILLALIGISPVSLKDAVIGAMAGYLSLWSVYHIFKLLTNKEGLGYGDFKLRAARGAWSGWQSLALIILLASLVGTIGGLITLKLRKQNKDHAFPFGPYLAIAGWMFLLWGEHIQQWYYKLY